MFARYSFAGAAVGALGALAAGVVDWFAPAVAPATTINILFVLYGLLGLLTFALYRGLSAAVEVGDGSPPVPLGPSRRRVYGLAALFSIDALGGGLVVNALLALWLYERFGLSVSTTGAIFFGTSFAPRCPISLRCRSRGVSGSSIRWCLPTFPPTSCSILTAFAPTIEVAFLLLILRGLLSEMDSPTRSSYVMAVVRPEERPAAASVTCGAAQSCSCPSRRCYRDGYSRSLRLAARNRRRTEGDIRSRPALAVLQDQAAGGAQRQPKRAIGGRERTSLGPEKSHDIWRAQSLAVPVGADRNARGDARWQATVASQGIKPPRESSGLRKWQARPLF